MTNEAIYYDIEKKIDKLIVENFQQFKPTRLYIKRIKRSDGTYMYYFGKSISPNIVSYTG